MKEKTQDKTKELYMDNYCEQLVGKVRTGADYVKMGGIGTAAVLLAAVFMFFAMIFGFYSLTILAVLSLFGGVWLLGGMNVEYEYIVTNNEMDIDKITGKRKRKRMITVDLSNAEDFIPFGTDNTAADATVHASSGVEKDAYCLLVNHSSYGMVKVVFNPNEKLREAIMQEVPGQLRMKIRNNGQ